MPSFMLPKFFPTAETCRADVYPISNLADWICAFYSNGMGEVAVTRVALDLQARFVHSYYVIRGKVREKPSAGLETGHKIPCD